MTCPQTAETCTRPADVSLADFFAWLESPEYRAHIAACAAWAADDPRLIVGHVGSYG